MNKHKYVFTLNKILCNEYKKFTHKYKNPSINFSYTGYTQGKNENNKIMLQTILFHYVPFVCYDTFRIYQFTVFNKHQIQHTFPETNTMYVKLANHIKPLAISNLRKTVLFQ